MKSNGLVSSNRMAMVPGTPNKMRSSSGAKFVFAEHTKSVRACTWSPDGSCVASGSNDSTVRIWDCVFGTCLLTLTGHTNSILSLSWSPDGKRLASGSCDHSVRVRNPCHAMVNLFKCQRGCIRSAGGLRTLMSFKIRDPASLFGNLVFLGHFDGYTCLYYNKGKRH